MECCWPPRPHGLVYVWESMANSTMRSLFQIGSKLILVHSPLSRMLPLVGQRAVLDKARLITWPSSTDSYSKSSNLSPDLHCECKVSLWMNVDSLRPRGTPVNSTWSNNLRAKDDPTLASSHSQTHACHKQQTPSDLPSAGPRVFLDANVDVQPAWETRERMQRPWTSPSAELMRLDVRSPETIAS